MIVLVVVFVIVLVMQCGVVVIRATFFFFLNRTINTDTIFLKKINAWQGDTLAEILFQGWDGDTYESASQIRTVVENAGTPVGNSQMGGKIFVVRGCFLCGTGSVWDWFCLGLILFGTDSVWH